MVLAATVALAAALVGIPARSTYGAQVSVDEPQYLLTAISIAEDRSLDISDEIDRGAYLDYHEIPLNTQTRELDASGRRVSPHDPLLPALLAPAMWLGGWVAAKATLALTAAACAAAMVWVAVRRFAVAPRVAAVVAGAVSVGIPIAAYGSQVYPEMPAALAVLVAFGAITAPSPQGAATAPSPQGAATAPSPQGAATAPSPQGAATAIALAALVALPWLSVKYVPVAAVLGIGLLVARARGAPPGGWRRSMLAPLAVAAAAAAVYLLAHQAWYGGWTVYAAGDHFADSGELSVVGTGVDPAGRARRLVGLLVDRGFGLAAWSPVWLGAPAALGWLAGRRSPHGGLLIAAVAAGWLNATFVALTMHGWWVPGRQVVVVLPLAAVAMAVLADARPWLARGAAAVGLVGAVNWFWLAVEASTGQRTLVVDFAATAALPYRVLRPLWPDGLTAGPADEVRLAIWALVVVAAGTAGWRAARAGPAPSRPRGPTATGDAPLSAGTAPR